MANHTKRTAHGGPEPEDGDDGTGIDVDGMDFGAFDLDGLDFDLDGFDLDGDALDLAAPGKIETRYIRPPAYIGERQSAVSYDRAVDLVRELGPRIFAGDRIFAVVSGNFIFGDMIEALCVEGDLLVDDLTISTLAISKDNVDSLRNLLVGGYVKRLGLIVSDYFFAHNRENVGYIYEQLDVEDRFQLAVAGTHTKITLLEVAGRKIVMHGSANLRSSRSVENVQIETNPELYDFCHEWHHRILERYGTIRQSIRVGPLFDLIQEETP